MATERTVLVRATNREVLRLVRRLPAVAAGAPGGLGFTDQLLIRMGLAALGRIRTAFLVKARGGTDESGLRWKPLSPFTIAYTRRHPGLPAKATRARFRPSWMLTAEQRTRWWSLYGRYLAVFRGDKHHAAAAAWTVLKDEGAQTIMDVYGNTPVEILRDTGLLFNSLSPGVPAGVAPASPPRVPKQVFRVGRGEVIVGTNRKWAWTHHKGVPNRLPQRRLWPEPSRWPSSWWRDIQEQALHGLIDLAVHLFERLT